MNNQKHQAGNASLEMILALNLGLTALIGVLTICWLLGIKSVMQSLSSEAASIVAHQQLYFSASNKAQASVKSQHLHAGLRRQIAAQLNGYPLVSFLTQKGTAIRLRIEGSENPRSDVTVGLYLCPPRLPSLLQSTATSEPDPLDRDCLGQFTSTEGPEGRAWLFVQSTHPPLASVSIYERGLSHLPLEQERARVVALYWRLEP